MYDVTGQCPIGSENLLNLIDSRTTVGDNFGGRVFFYLFEN